MTEDSTSNQPDIPEFDRQEWFESLPATQKLTAIMGALAVLVSPEVQKKVNEADEDDLTHLPNRRRFREEYDQIIQKHPHPRNLALALFDLDKLKQINDTQGHDRGDEYITLFAEFLKKHVQRRGSEVLARGRLGGDEFCALVDLAQRHEEEIPVTPEVRSISYEAWLRHDFELELQSKPSLKDIADFSIGFAFYEDGKSFGEMMKEADSAMYLQKQTRGTGR